TERQLLAFTQGKEHAGAQLDAIQTRLAERAPQLKAVRLGRILAPLAQVIREFDVHGMIGSKLLVAGTHAITAYEAMAGHFFDAELTATEDLDLVWRQGKNVEILVKNSESFALLKHLKTVDSSYTVNTERTFQARNNKGLIIDFISDEEGVANAPKEYLKPIALPGQEWLIKAATLSVVAIDTNGLPVKLAVPDPRVFALHKVWVSQRADRNPLKKAKDLNQAVAVAALVKQFLPQFPFDGDFIATLSDELRELYSVQIAPVIAQMGSSTAPLM
ncbi:MAG TPA: GSU2403 family nucleotidyltransferase fold protein, partial [Cellvibrionaceae bacterium]|nr:GSU2403 family nucleotidyltransferase fold protein [Cellvibrionaceae bacterium]